MTNDTKTEEKKTKPINKTYVLDTNIILTDYKSVAHLGNSSENTVLIPDVVIGEVDKFKKDHILGTNARKFAKLLYDLGTKGNLTEGVRLREGGTLKVSSTYLPKETLIYNSLFKLGLMDPLKSHPNIGENDLNIIRCALQYQRKNPGELVKLISNDNNVVNVARLNNIKSEYEERDRIDPNTLTKGYIIISGEKNASLIKESMCGGGKPWKIKDIDESWAEKLIANQYVVFLNSAVADALAHGHIDRLDSQFIKRYDIIEDALVPIGYNGDSIWGFKPKNLEQFLLFDIGLNPAIKASVATGLAGTGKSLLQLLFAIKEVDDKRKAGEEDAKVLFTRRSVDSIENVGYLPGDLIDKIMPGNRGVVTNYFKIMFQRGKNKDTKNAYSLDYDLHLLKSLRNDEQSLIEMLPIGKAKGETFGEHDSVVWEEAQDAEYFLATKIWTRLSNGKIYMNGDCTQTDNPATSPERNALTFTVKAIMDKSDEARKTRNPSSLKYASLCSILALEKPERGLMTELALHLFNNKRRK